MEKIIDMQERERERESSNSKKENLVKQIEDFDNNYFNQDQKEIVINILKKAPENEVQAYADFLFMKRGIGFVFDYSPEISKGRIITLREDKNKRINVTDDIDDNENKLIIGDNYNALKSLLITHKKIIDIIYIDPPYNTESAKADGNNDSYKEGTSLKFIYKDKFGRSGWLNMMKDRLTLAKDLLSDDGVIFVSIDDSEQAYLKVLMDDIFGEKNFVANINWQSSFGGKNDTKLIPINTEYILCYSFAKHFEKNILSTNKKYNYHDNNFDIYGKYKISPLCWGSLPYSKKLDFIIYINDQNGEKKISFEKNENTIGKIISGPSKLNNDEKIKLYEQRHLGIHNKNDWCFYWSKETIMKAFNLNFINLENKNNEWFISQKEYENAKFSGKEKKIIEGRSNKIALRNVISDSKITSKIGTEEIENIFMRKTFDYPKPMSLLKKLFLVKDSNVLILDFFAGSGTTAHAVMDLNNDDGGNRKFILCTNNENNIAHNVTYERLHRIIMGIGTNHETDFNWSKENKPYKKNKLRVIDIDDNVKISLDSNIDDNIFEDCKSGLKLLNQKYNQQGLNLYYDLAALNPLKKDCK